MESWIKLDRGIMDSWLWRGEDVEKFTRGQAYIDLCLQAAYCDHDIRLGNQIVTVKKGSFYTSVRRLSERWKWSKSSVSDFLNLLADQHMITKVSDTKRTLITVENQGFRQSQSDFFGHAPDTARTQSGRTEESIESNINIYTHTRARAREEDTGLTDLYDSESLPIAEPDPRPPTLDEVRQYCREHRLTVNPDRFWQCYQSRDWISNGRRITDWKAQLEYWQATDQDNRVSKAHERALEAGMWMYG